MAAYTHRAVRAASIVKSSLRSAERLRWSRESSSLWLRRGTATTTPRWMSTDSTIDIQERSEELFTKVVLPANARTMGPMDQSATQITPMPMVFVLGNHSSGKSSFLNYIIGRDVQTEGLAPTDDGFTVIAPGHEDVDQDGPALIGDVDLGYVTMCHGLCRVVLFDTECAPCCVGRAVRLNMSC